MAPSEKRRSRSILVDLALWLSLSMLLVGCLVVVSNSRISGARVEQHLNKLAYDLVHDLAEQLSEDIWNMDDQAIAGYFVAYPWHSLGLTSVKVTTEFDDFLYSKEFAKESDTLSHRTAVFHGDEVIGYVEAFVSRKQLRTIQRTIGRSGFMILAPAILIVFLVCTLIIRVVVIRPVKKTIDGVRRIASGDYDYRLSKEGSREIDSINEEINAMAREINIRRNQLQKEIAVRHAAESELKDLNDELEQRIKDRTRQLRRLARMLTSAQDVEQQRIAEGLHDDVAQLLAACRMKIQIASANSNQEDMNSFLTAIDNLANQAYEQIRLLSFELASSTLYRWGLKDSLEQLCGGMSERYDMSFKVNSTGDLGRLNETSSTILFKAARELLFNVVKHSGSKEASVFLSREGDVLTLTVEDKGKGFRSESDIGAGKGLGLFAIRERLEDIGGKMEVDSRPNIRTRVVLTAPYQEEESEK